MQWTKNVCNEKSGDVMTQSLLLLSRLSNPSKHINQ